MSGAGAEDGFLGRGWRLGLGDTEGDSGVGLDGQGRIAEASGEELVRQSIWIILGTAPGERVGRPEFGCGIHELVFAPQSAATMGELARMVGDALARWEPRIDVLDVNVYPSPDDPNGLLIDVDYLIRATNSRLNLVYPFYLET